MTTFFALRRRQRRHAEVHPVSAHRDTRAPVLRPEAVRDVELRHDLHARYERNPGRFGEDHHLPQHAVDAVAHRNTTLFRLEMDVRRARLDAFRNDPVDELNDRTLCRSIRAELHVRFFDRLGD